MTNQKTNSNTSWATIELDYVHPHDLKGQAAVEWILQDIKQDQPNFLVECIGTGGGGWPSLLVSGERQDLRKWYCEVCNPEHEDVAEEFEEWCQTYKVDNQ